MNNKLQLFFSDKEQAHEKQQNGIVSIDPIHITDTTSNNGTGINIGCEIPNINSLKLINNNKIQVYYYAFANFSFLKEKYNNRSNQMRGFENYNTQNPPMTNCYKNCECILFPYNIPNDKRNKSWILFVEAKYAESISTAQNYPTDAINQVISTVLYLRRHEVIPSNKNIKAIITLPNIPSQTTLLSLFKYHEYLCDESLFDVKGISTSKEMSLENIKKKYNINIIPCNEAKITDWKNLKFPV